MEAPGRLGRLAATEGGAEHRGAPWRKGGGLLRQSGGLWSQEEAPREGAALPPGPPDPTEASELLSLFPRSARAPRLPCKPCPPANAVRLTALRPSPAAGPHPIRPWPPPSPLLTHSSLDTWGPPLGAPAWPLPRAPLPQTALQSGLSANVPVSLRTPDSTCIKSQLPGHFLSAVPAVMHFTFSYRHLTPCILPV